MNLKKTWNKKYGKSQIITKDNSTCKNVEIDMVRLADGETKSYNEEGKEFGLLILGGKCTVEADSFKYVFQESEVTSQRGQRQYKYCKLHQY